MLKKKLGTQATPEMQLPSTNDDGKFLVEPVQILARRMIKRGNKPVPQVLVQWFNLPREQASWEDYDQLKAQFLHFDP